MFDDYPLLIVVEPWIFLYIHSTNCFNTTSIILSNVRVRFRVRVRVTFHSTQKYRAFWFWAHDEVVIKGSYMKGAWVRMGDNYGNVSAFNFYNLCYWTNWAWLSPFHVGCFSVSPQHDAGSFHTLKNKFIWPTPSHVWIGAQWEYKEGGGMKGHVVWSVEWKNMSYNYLPLPERVLSSTSQHDIKTLM